MTRSAPVLVAGAGPSGLVAALTLLQNNVPVRIITKELEYQLGQRGTTIWPRTLEVFHFLHVFEIPLRARSVLPGQEYKPSTVEPSKTFQILPHNDPTPSTPYYNPVWLGQAAQEGILRSYLEKYGCSVELGTELVSFEDDGERVLAKLIKRKDGQEITEVFEASYLVGADGAKGITRKQLGLTFLGETRDEFGVVVGDVCLKIEGIDRNHWHFLGDRSSIFIMLRPSDDIAPDGFQLVIYTKDYEPKHLIADQRLIAKCISKLTGQQVDLRKAITLSQYRPNIRMVEKFGVGRVFVAGDAAHVHTPAGGQGLNSSIQDAFNLSWKVSLVYKGLSPATLLDSYTAERLPVIAEMLNITTGILDRVRLSSMDGAMIREQKLNMLGVNCRSSPIVLDEFTQAEPVNAYGVLVVGVLVAGDRAPDAPELALTSADGAEAIVTRLFDVFRPAHHTVLVFTPDAASATDVLDASKRYPAHVVRLMVVLPQGSEVTSGVQADEVVVDRSGHAYRAYLTAKGEKKIVVVRPDGVVGAMVHGAEGVELYFSKIFVY